MRLSPFIPRDAAEIVLQPAQQLDWHARQQLEAQFTGSLSAFTLRAADGRILFCGGAVERHPPLPGTRSGHAQLWALFASAKGAAMHALLRMTRQFIVELPHARVDAAVDDTPAAIRWAELVGLRFDFRLADGAPGGGDLLVYRRNG